MGPRPTSLTQASRWTRGQRPRPFLAKAEAVDRIEAEGWTRLPYPPSLTRASRERGDDDHRIPGLEMDKATTAGAMGRVPIPVDALALLGAVSDLLVMGLEVDEATTAAAFRATADAVDHTEADRWTQRPYLPSSTQVSRLTRCQQSRHSSPRSSRGQECRDC